jgi:hypothetical protein
MITEKYQREAEWIAIKFYKKDWHKLSDKLRQEIYEMAVESVNKQKTMDKASAQRLLEQRESYRARYHRSKGN